MRVFFINPPSNSRLPVPHLEPLGLCYVGAVCREAGHDVEICDLVNRRRADVPALFARLDAFHPEVVGFTAFSEHFGNALELARAIKSRYGCTTVFGGWHVSGEPREVLKPAIDFVVRGEGEETMIELLDHLAGRGRPLAEIEGLAYPQGESFRLTPPRKRNRRLSRLPRPLREGLPIDAYQYPMLFSQPISRMQTLSVQASRGCPYKCTFCQTPALWGNLWSWRTAADVVDEVEDLVGRYGINTLIFRDEEFTIRPRWVSEICEELIRRGLPERLSWGSFARVDDMTPELVALMRRAGSTFACMGIEASTDEQQRRIQKFYKREQAEEALRLFRRAGITTYVSWIIGFPWDTPESLDGAFEWLLTLEIDFLSAVIATPFGGTELRRQVEEDGLLLTEDPDRFNLYEPTIRTPAIPTEMLRQLPGRYRRRFYLRPRKMAHTARELLRHPSHLRTVLELIYNRVIRNGMLRADPPSARFETPFRVPEEWFAPRADLGGRDSPEAPPLRASVGSL